MPHGDAVASIVGPEGASLYFGTFCFVCALIHIFSVGWFSKRAQRYVEGSIQENLYHLLAEVEIVFPLWAAIALGGFAFIQGGETALHYFESRNYTEPMFVFTIMAIAATLPVARFAEAVILRLSKTLPINPELAFFFILIGVGPLLGSAITEPAAMTLICGVLADKYFRKGATPHFLYSVFAAVLVCVSIGGAITHFAAPPVVMISSAWQWDTPYMLTHFGWKSIIVVLGVAGILTVLLRSEIIRLAGVVVAESEDGDENGNGAVSKLPAPLWLQAIHILAIALTVVFAHHPAVFLGVLFGFMGLIQVTKEFQESLRVRQSLLVGGFLAGLIILGGFQTWWLEPLLTSLSDGVVYVVVTGLTTITDNAALTFLASLIPSLSETVKYMIVAGALVGGGMTLIANAPNPIANAILARYFPNESVSPIKLAIYALPPTALAFLAFWVLPNL